MCGRGHNLSLNQQYASNLQSSCELCRNRLCKVCRRTAMSTAPTRRQSACATPGGTDSNDQSAGRSSGAGIPKARKWFTADLDPDPDPEASPARKDVIAASAPYVRGHAAHEAARREMGPRHELISTDEVRRNYLHIAMHQARSGRIRPRKYLMRLSVPMIGAEFAC